MKMGTDQMADEQLKGQKIKWKIDKTKRGNWQNAKMKKRCLIGKCKMERWERWEKKNKMYWENW